MRSIALSRGRFVVLTLATVFSGLALLFVSLVDLGEAEGLSVFWRLLLGLVGLAEVGMAGFYFRVVLEPELFVDDHNMTLPWSLGRKEREIEWQRVSRAEVTPTRLAWSNQPVLHLVGVEGQRNIEIPRGNIKDWDGLLAAVGDRVGPVLNTFNER